LLERHGGRFGQPGGGIEIIAGLGDDADLAAQVGAIVRGSDDLKARRAHDEQIHSAVVEAIDADDLCQRPDVIRSGGPGLTSFLDRDHAKAVALFQAIRDHLPVAGFEDVQRQRHMRKEHDVDRKERQPLSGHQSSIWAYSAASS